MKTILFLATLLFSVNALGQTQGTSMRSTNGHGYATTIIENLVGKIATGNATNAAGSRVAYLSDVTGSTNGFVSVDYSIVTNIAAYQAFIATNNFLATLTNVAAYQAFLATNGWTAIATNIAAYEAFLVTNSYAPTVTNIANFLIQAATNNFSLRYPTNQAIATSIDVGNKYTGYATNANIAISGCANVDATGTNVSWGILTITNTAGSAAVKTITIPAAWVDVDNLGGTTIYNTNQGVLSVMVQPFLGTNFIWRGK